MPRTLCGEIIRQLRPPLAVDDTRNTGRVNTVFSAKLRLAHIAVCINLFNLSDLFRSQLALRYNSFAAYIPALSISISHILFVGSKKQMIWIYTGANITPMADVQAFRNWAMRLLVDISVSRNAAASTDRNFSVPSTSDAPN